jgi:acetolactate synthase I/II/III large subunit
MPTGGQLIVQCLEAQGTDRVFCVPGESYLAILDALYDSGIETVVARHEGGAAMMAEADGKATGRPGICLVTRGPGASNAMSGIHVAQQDSTPLIVIVGQVARDYRGRDAFQEMDYTRTFADIAKLVIEINNVNRIPEVMARAFQTAMNGRPGPVLLSVPEDMLVEETPAAVAPRVTMRESVPAGEIIDAFNNLLNGARKPIVIAGGSCWDQHACSILQRWANDRGLPVAASFRRQHLFPADHTCYAGELGIGANPALLGYIHDSDLVILLGGRLSEIPSQNYTLMDIPIPRQKLVHIHPGAEELGRVYKPTLAVNASPISFLQAMNTYPGTDRNGTPPLALHDSYLAWSGEAPKKPGDVQLGEIVRHLSDTLPDNAIITNGAGNYAAWVHRFFRYKSYRTQFAPTSGSMGYGLPAAIAAKLRFPDRPVICFAGDGCLQMTINELGTAMQFNAGIIVLVVDNGTYGTIRMHQERNYPSRISATDLVNPDFERLADAYGYFTGVVTRTEQFAELFSEALRQSRPSLIRIKTEAEAISPTTTITALREGH